MKVAQSRRKTYLACAACLCGALQGSVQAADVGSPPEAAAQQKMLDDMRIYASEYIDKLPNFICQQVTQQLEAGKKPTKWHKGDTIVSKLIFSQGREQRRLELVNDKAVEPSRFVRRPLVTEGEFGVLLANVFNEKTEAAFSWNGWQTVRGHRLAVFDFDVSKEHSTLRLSLSDLAHATVPYRGSVFADPSSGAVFRITNSAYDIPPDVRTKSIETTIDYDSIAIAGRDYLLPVEASVLMDTGSRHVLNRLEFRAYQKFEAESSITYTSDPPK